MDFHSLISTAQQNIASSNAKGNFYKAGFEPPKKMTKEKKLSAGIQKFLEQRKKEEEEQAERARQKKLELVAKRDPKEQRKIEKSLKVIKSSTKFFSGESMDEGTASLQPDEDDYGYTSTISDQFHKKLMEKYQSMPEDKKFSSGTGKNKSMSKEEMQRTKDRVKNAFTTPDDDQQPQIRHGPHHRTSKIKSDKDQRQAAAAPLDKKPFLKPKPKLKAAPIVDFQQLLKLAEQKQHEEITIEVQAKKEPERLLTQKEKRELEEVEAARRARMKPNRIPKLGAIPKIGESPKQDKNNNDSSDKKSSTSQFAKPAAPSSSSQRLQQPFKKPALSSSSSSTSNNSSKLRDALQQRQNETSSRPSSSNNPKVPSSSKLANSSNGSAIKSRDPPMKSASNGQRPTNGQRPSNSSVNSKVEPYRPSASSSKPKASEKPREFPPKDLMRSREFPPKDLMRSREFPPKDLMRSREFPPRDTKRLSQQQISRKRRVIEDEESDYDSEMDDFIDDGEDDGDYSSEIKKIFGYDKSRYRDEDFDDSQMESDYKTVMKEEFISKKLGILEDLEDMRMEEEENKRKAMRKKRKL